MDTYSHFLKPSYHLTLLTEYIDGGTLSDLLLDHSVELSWKQRIAFAKDIAAGMVRKKLSLFSAALFFLALLNNEHLHLAIFVERNGAAMGCLECPDVGSL